MYTVCYTAGSRACGILDIGAGARWLCGSDRPHQVDNPRCRCKSCRGFRWFVRWHASRLAAYEVPTHCHWVGDCSNSVHVFYSKVVVVVVVTRSDQPKPPAVAIVCQNGLSSASCSASVAVTPVSRQIWWIQVVGGRPLARLHSCEGRSPSLFPAYSKVAKVKL